MNDTWSLDVLYRGYDDPKFLEDLKKADQICDNMNELSKTLSKYETKDALNRIVDVLEEMTAIAESLGVYCSLRQSVNTEDAQSVSYLGQLNEKFSNVAKAETIFNKYIASVDDLDSVVGEDARLGEYRYLLENAKKQSKYLLSDDVEEIIAKMNITGANAWAELQSFLTSTVKIDYEGKECTLSEIRNLAYSPDEAVRKKAYEAELAGYDKIKDSVAYSLNSIKAQVSMITKLRGYESPLDYTLKQAHMKKETLDAMLLAMNEFMPKFREYFKCKGKLLGHENGLPWYDLFAPVGKSDRKFTAEEARDYLVSHFEGFAPDLANMVQQAFDESWIDFYPRKGKVGGAFCCNIQTKKVSRVLTNFDGSLSDIVTLAHELGHAYHNKNIHDHRVLNNDYSMPVAETASTFNENVIVNAAIAESTGKEKIALIESQLQDLAQIIVDIYSRYRFETMVFEQRAESFMFADTLCDIMTKAQEESYGDGLDPEFRHPYMWVCKGHYYSGSLSFYNFPYAFGGLFARGLYAKYVEEGADFLPKYRALLHATPVCDVEDAAMVAGINLTDPEFWRSALAQAAKQIDEFIELSKSL